MGRGAGDSGTARNKGGMQEAWEAEEIWRRGSVLEVIAGVWKFGNAGGVGTGC